MKSNCTTSKFKPRDRVWDAKFGWGVISSVDENDKNYPLKVIFHSPFTAVIYYTLEGRYLREDCIRLFHEEGNRN